MEKELGEIIVKKEKLESGENVKVKEESLMVPEIVFIDGKIQVVKPDLSRNDEKIHTELEIVNSSKAKMTTSTSFKPVNHTEKWTEQETNKFYRVTKFG